MKNIYFVAIAFIIIVYIVSIVKKGEFSIKESIYWVAASFLMLILAIFPRSIDIVAKYLEIDYSPSLFFTLCIIFLILINFRNSRKIVKQEDKIISLAQDLAVLKGEIEK